MRRGRRRNRLRPATSGDRAVAGAGVRVCDSVWTAAAVQSVVFEQVSELDGSNRADGVDGPSADGWTDQIKATPSLINRSIASEAVDENHYDSAAEAGSTG
uniref:(northern house mosquito) hypothetical protein n=1 Tax=Culex pipiens TaxID=7175 RepID=A0A8D8C4F1_CULPI